MKIFKYSVGALGTNAYIILDEKTMEAMLVDPGDEPDKLLNALESKGAHLTYIILTHAHFDHILAIPKIKEKTGASLLVHKDDAPMLADNSLNLLSRFSVRDMAFPSPDRLLTDGDTVTVGQSVLTVCHTPGHTPGSICLFDEEAGAILTGDTLFREAIGRYDFPDGDYHTLIASLAKLVKVCGDRDYKLCPGHGTSTHLSYELEHNLYLN